tara:strand:+ start:53 stop:643 length:591 start_codon:yes stop_codon:yes gene_type:complete
MKIELFIFIVTAFFVANTYYDGKYVQIMKSWKKYYQMGGIAFAGLSLYLFIRKNPAQAKDLLQNANGMVKYMPLDKEAGDLLTPVLNFAKNQVGGSNVPNPQGLGFGYVPPQHKRMLNSGINKNSSAATKRSVSETKKKYVAAQQGWKCRDCSEQLSHTFEVDHRQRLDQGGSNHVDNLDALCRNCHGKRTAQVYL